MREIKFRAWDGKKMFNVDVLAISPCRWDSSGTGISLAFQPHIKVMQYTGLKDRHGKEIYEGDIIVHQNFPRNKALVEFREGAFYAGNVLLSHNHFSAIEVVGNTYENPELLEGDSDGDN